MLLPVLLTKQQSKHPVRQRHSIPGVHHHLKI